MSVALDQEDLDKYIPYYLTQPQKEALSTALDEFNERGFANYYIDRYHEETLQGDCWTELPIVDVVTGERKQVKGVILSNSCDVSPDNTRAITPKLVFAPIISLEGYLTGLKEDGMNDQQIQAKADSIKKQQVTSVFYLPRTNSMNGDGIILLDDVYSIPSDILSPKRNQKVFTLSMTGFYLFLFKLSVHFCRFHEGVER